MRRAEAAAMHSPDRTPPSGSAITPADPEAMADASGVGAAPAPAVRDRSAAARKGWAARRRRKLH